MNLGEWQIQQGGKRRRRVEGPEGTEEQISYGLLVSTEKRDGGEIAELA